MKPDGERFSQAFPYHSSRFARDQLTLDLKIGSCSIEVDAKLLQEKELPPWAQTESVSHFLKSFSTEIEQEPQNLLALHLIYHLFYNPEESNVLWNPLNTLVE